MSDEISMAPTPESGLGVDIFSLEGSDGRLANPDSRNFSDRLSSRQGRRRSVSVYQRKPPNIAFSLRKYRPNDFRPVDWTRRAWSAPFRMRSKAGAIAHAFMLTGVRGVGKTTTARIIAQGAELHWTGRRRRADNRRPAVSATIAGHRRRPSCRRHGDGRRQPDRRRRCARADRRRALSPGLRRATRSTSSTKCICSRATPSTHCSRPWRSRRPTWSSSSPRPRSARCR